MQDIVVASINQIVLWFLYAIVLINFVFSINWFVFFVLAIGSLIFIIKGKKSGFVTSMNWFIPFLLAVGILVFIIKLGYPPLIVIFFKLIEWFILFALVVGVLIFFIAKGKGIVKESVLLFLKIVLPVQSILFLTFEFFRLAITQIGKEISSVDDSLLFLPLFHLSTGIAPFVVNKSKAVKLVISLFMVVIVIRYGVYLDRNFQLMHEEFQQYDRVMPNLIFIFDSYCFFTNLGVLIYMWRHESKGA